jgi:DNA topoisomerase-1
MPMTAKELRQVPGLATRTADPVESAKMAGLRYVTDRRPGIGRKRAGKGFTYINVDGSTICDPAEIHRIAVLAIPPAWTEVWICSIAHGHLQATGRDAKGRKQYR